MDRWATCKMGRKLLPELAYLDKNWPQKSMKMKSKLDLERADFLFTKHA